ncbi:MAG: sigma-70 family RNA polymerase sigma factor [Chloroherpetonaceae bacterium]
MSNQTTDIESIWKEYKQNNDINLRNKIIENYSWVVNYTISKMNLPTNIIIDYDDFRSFGMLALIESIEKYDINLGTKFETYAVIRIKGKIKDELRNLDLLSRTARKKVSEIYQTKETLTREKNREVSIDEIRQRLNLTQDQFQSYLSALDTSRAYSAASDISQTFSDEDDDEIENAIEDIADTSQDDGLEKLAKLERKNFIQSFLTRLPRNKRLVIILYYYEELNFKQISQVLAISEGRVSQIHSEVIKNLKNELIKEGYA